MQCPRCLERNPFYFFKGSKGIYCRRCVQFKRFLIEQNIKEEETVYLGVDADYQLTFQLTSAQKKCSQALCKWIEKEDILLYAICGAGKTEIILECASQYLRKGKRVGIAIPRRQVVLELAKRLQKAFYSLSVIPVCEGYTKCTHADLIICTTHQLFRYYQYFDLLIVDEPDAFPYAGNQVLKGIVKTSCKGRFLFLTATPDYELLKLKTIKLFERPHGYPLTEPKIQIYPRLILFILLWKWLQNQKRSLIFVPTIQIAEILGTLFQYPVIHSKSKNKEEIIRKFKNRELKHIFCTTILERGVTFEEVDICVLFAEHPVFTLASLIQILGRVGRSMKYPIGKGLLLCTRKSKTVIECLRIIQQINALSASET